MDEKIVFIGAGNMAEAILAGLVQKKLYEPQQIYVTNRQNKERLHYIKQTYQVHVSQQAEEVIEGAAKIILAVKPKDIVECLQGIKDKLTEKQLLISVLAGVATDTMEEIIGKQIPIIRAMPNTSATIGLSATAISCGTYAKETDVQSATALFQTVGTVEIVKEEEIHAVTGISGSGPAYFYLFVEALEKAAQEMGLEREKAKNLITQTIIGAGEMLKHTKKDAATLRKEVMSPNGTTEAAINVLLANEVDKAIVQCAQRAKERSIEMGNELIEAVKKQI